MTSGHDIGREEARGQPSPGEGAYRIAFELHCRHMTYADIASEMRRLGYKCAGASTAGVWVREGREIAKAEEKLADEDAHLRHNGTLSYLTGKVMQRIETKPDELWDGLPQLRWLLAQYAELHGLNAPRKTAGSLELNGSAGLVPTSALLANLQASGPVGEPEPEDEHSP